MLSEIKQRIDREDEGFTLIELMVVVLIIAILLAIAIPTFLGARNSANARAAQSDLRNALTAEQSWWTNNQVFTSDTSTSTGLPTIEGSLNWTNGSASTTTPNEIAVVTGNFTGGPSNSVVLLEAQGKDNNCYYIEQSNDPAASFTGYQEVKGGCATLSAPSGSAPAMNQKPASQNVQSTFDATNMWSSF